MHDAANDDHAWGLDILSWDNSKDMGMLFSLCWQSFCCIALYIED